MAPIVVNTPTPTPTASPTPGITPTATPILTPTPLAGTPTPTPTPQPGTEPLPALPSNCIASVTPSEAFNALGRPHNVYFLCGNAAATLPGPASSPYPSVGCFDVTASAVDATNGSAIPFTQVRCGGVAATTGNSADCTGVQNPICPVGYAPTGAGGSCVLVRCPANFTYSATDSLCHFNPGTTGVCPPGSTPVTSGGAVVDCTEPPISAPTPQQTNVVEVTINPGSPHDYYITFSGFVGTTAGGSCPADTTLVPSVNLTPTGTGATPFTGPACRFSLTVEKKYVEGTSLQVIPIGQCGAFVPPDITGTFGGTPCFFEVKATGTTILKQNINCSDPGEPATGTDATGAGFPTGSTYECTNGTLRVVNIPIPGLEINITAQNGIFSPTCIPQSRRPMATPTPTGTPSGIPTNTPLPTNTPVSTPTSTPTATPVPGTPQPLAGSSGPGFCGPPGSPTTTVITDQNGIAGEVGQQIEYRARAVPGFPPANTYEDVIGEFLQDGFGQPGAHMYATFNFAEASLFCDSGFTDASGVALCAKYVDQLSAGQTVTVPVSFLYNCTEYDTSTSFTPVGLNTPTPTPGPASNTPPPFLIAPSPNGICVQQVTAGPLTVTASFAPLINTQPALTTGPVVLGEFTNNTPTPTPTNTPVPALATSTTTTTTTPSPTNTPSPTATPTRTPTPTPTPSPTPTSTPTATPVAVHTLKFSVDAARVAKYAAHPTPNKKGVTSVSQGERVDLLVYYTIRDLPKKLPRVDTYAVTTLANRTVFKVAFKETVGPAPKDVGSSVRFTTFAVPTNLPFGIYQFRATVQIGKVSATRMWKFAIMRRFVFGGGRDAATDEFVIRQSLEGVTRREGRLPVRRL